jgi:glycerol kinase
MAGKEGSHFLTIDQGTSGTKVLLFSRAGTLTARLDKPHRQFYPQPGWVEHDPEEIYEHMVCGMREIMDREGVRAEDIICISISNQRETVVMWDRESGKPVMHAVVWQCSRAAEECRTIAEAGKAAVVKEKTGLVLSPYFSAAKANWIVDHVQEARLSAARGTLLFGTVDSYLVWKLTGGTVHVTDYSNASRTQLFNIRTLQWDEELLDLFHLNLSMMPEVIDSNATAGFVDKGIFGTEIPLAGILGDSHAALFGQCCTKRGMAKATYGTGSSVMMNIGDELRLDSQKVVTSIGYAIDGTVTYVLEGNINSTGATLKWLVDDIELFSSEQEASALAASVESNDGVYLVPALVGLSAPYWNSEVRGVISNLTRGTKKAHIARAAEESTAYQILDVIRAMEEEAGIVLEELRVDGGPTRDAFLMQFQADIADTAVTRSGTEELSAVGAMFMGGLALSVWQNLAELEALRETNGTFTSKRGDRWRESAYGGWKRAVENLLNSK